MQVMLIDRDSVFAGALWVVLANEGFELTWFETAEAARDDLRGGSEYGAILLCWDGPAHDVSDTLKWLHAASGDTPVIVIGASGTGANEESALIYGAHAFVWKSSPISLLARRLEAIAGRRALRRSGRR